MVINWIRQNRRQNEKGNLPQKKQVMTGKCVNLPEKIKLKKCKIIKKYYTHQSFK